TIGYDIPLRKSRSITRQERQVYDMCKKLDMLVYKVPTSVNKNDKNHLWKLQESHIIGLTRRERKLKQLLLICLTHLKRTENKKEISYWLSEWEGTNALSYTRGLSISEVWQRLYEQVISGWTDHHEVFLNQLVRTYPIIKNEWRHEQPAKRNKENQK